MSTTSLEHIQSLAVLTIYSRRLLLHAPLYTPNAAAASSPSANPTKPENSFDANVVMILAVLLCALICALGLNSIVRCALRCSARMALEPDSNSAAARIALIGARRRAMRSLPILVYEEGMKLAGSAGSECAICLSEFIAGEKIRVLPKCNHAFHVKCIDRWLLSRSSCPTCRQCLFGNCQKVTSCAAVVSTVQSVIVPLEHEGRISENR